MRPGRSSPEDIPSGCFLCFLAREDAPVLDAITDKTVTELQALSFTTAAHDVDQGQTLTYSLGTNAPQGATISPSTGLFSWTPTEAQGPDTYTLTVIATDNGTPVLSASRAFNVTVMEDSHINAGKAANNGSPDTFRLVKSGTSRKIIENAAEMY